MDEVLFALAAWRDSPTSFDGGMAAILHGL
jgi:hypothetical protein